MLNHRHHHSAPLVAKLLIVSLAALSPATSAQVLLSEDFESGWRGYWSDNGVWQIGTPTAGPPSTPSGIACAATVLGGNYAAFTDARLRGFLVDLPPVFGDQEIRLQFMHWFSYSSCDAGRVSIKTADNTTFEPIGTSLVNWSTWSLKEVDLTNYAGQSVEIGFDHQADGSAGSCSSSSTGWYIDDVLVEVRDPELTGDFEMGWAGWSATRGVWQVGAPQSGPTPPSGIACAGTYMNGDYPAYTDSRFVSPSHRLPDADGDERVYLRFSSWFSYSSCDQANVQVSAYDESTGSWSAWSTEGSTLVNWSTWTLMSVEITKYAGQKVRFGFLHSADGSAGSCSSSSSGWFIDEVRVEKEFPMLAGDFEAGWNGWSATRGAWQIGAPNSGPVAAATGTGVAGTYLDGNYPAYTDSRLVSPAVRLPCDPGSGLLLRFSQWFSYSSCDAGYVQVSVWDKVLETWGSWETVGGATVNTSPWSVSVRDLSSYASEVIRFCFYHTADGSAGSCSSSSTGWYIDDVTLPISAFVNLGGSTMGVNAMGDPARPCLEMCGSLTGGSTMDLELSDASASQCAFVFISLNSSPLGPLFGGTLHAYPFDELLLLHTDATGSLLGSGPFPTLNSGTELWFQVVVQDPTVVPFGFALSNAVRGTVP